ncbi:MAG TPA: RcnB family protein [Phenylobacterium sp.]|nr:RcnB family protein [Phenylobacterium sp.]
MKRLILGVAAAAAVAGPIAAASEAAAQPRDRWERRDDRWDRRGQREDWRDNRRWDRNRYNGYYYRNTWFYGPPPPAYYNDRYYRPGYAPWRRGAVLPRYYRDYRVNDYYRYRLRPPPRGYAWYRVGDDYLLAAVASGLIFDIID